MLKTMISSNDRTTLITGPCSIYIGAFGVVEHTDVNDELSFSDWVFAANTQDGLTIEILNTFYTIHDYPGLKEYITAVATFHSNLTTLAWSNLKLLQDNYSKQDHHALLFRGWSKDDIRRDVIIRKTDLMQSVQHIYRNERKKDKQTTFPIYGNCLKVSNIISPIRIIDETD